MQLSKNASLITMALLMGLAFYNTKAKADIPPDDAAVDGATEEYPDGAVEETDGAVEETDGAVEETDGAVEETDGAVEDVDATTGDDTDAATGDDDDDSDGGSSSSDSSCSVSHAGTNGSFATLLALSGIAAVLVSRRRR